MIVRDAIKLLLGDGIVDEGPYILTLGSPSLSRESPRLGAGHRCDAVSSSGLRGTPFQECERDEYHNPFLSLNGDACTRRPGGRS